MEFRKVRALRGPNIWATFPVLEAWVDLGPLRDARPKELHGFDDRLAGWLPSLAERRAAVGERASLADALAEVALGLQRLAGSEVGFGRTRATVEPGVHRVVAEYREEALGRASLEEARELVLAAVEGGSPDVAAQVKRLRELAHQVRLGPSTAALVEAAKERGIPYRRLSANSLVQLGYGARQRRIYASMTDRTSAIADSIAKDKELTKTLLRSIGVPVPAGRPVDDADDAWQAAQELGVPVVVKPRDGDYGDGVSLNLTTREQVAAAYERAYKVSDDVLVEKYVAGTCHRLLVVGDRVIAAARRDPAQVVGDGCSTIAQLIEEVNRDPRRGDDHTTPLRSIRLDETALEILAGQGHTPDSIPPAGARVLIRRKTHLTTGGTDADVTDLLHPEVAARAVEATQVVGLDVAGLDVVAEDIGRPLEEQGGVIIEVNSGPGLRMHLEPVQGAPRPVHAAILDTLFPEGETGRIPVVAITGVNGKTTTTRLIAHVLQESGLTVGMTCTDGIYIGGRRIEVGDCSGPKSARAILLSPKVEAAALEVARGGLLREGLGFDRCQVAVVTNLGEGDHLGLGGVETIEDLALVKRTPVGVVLPGGFAVLKADDPPVAAMAAHCPGSIIYVARDEHHPVMAAHRASGGRVAFERDGSIVLAEGDREQPLVSVARIPLTHGGRVGFEVENALAASAACWALGVEPATIRAALESFVGDMAHVPGRFNVLHVRGATVIADFGHNPSALEALAEALDRFPHRRRSAVFSADGDRRDDAILRQARIVGETFDRVHIYEEEVRRRGRGAGEITALVRRGLDESSRTSEVIEADGELAAIEAALNDVGPGDLLVVLQDAVEASLAFIRNYLSSNNVPTREPEVAAASDGHPDRALYATQSLNEGRS
jgi:cyanophycin synthetase